MASVTGRLLTGRRSRSLVGYMGNKLVYADPILGVMGLHPGQGADAVMLVDAGPPGWMWRGLLIEDVRRRVAEILRSWQGQDPVELWNRLAKAPPPAELAEGIATWLWLQARSANSCPVWWDLEREAWRMGDKPRMGGQKDAVQRGDWRGAAGMAIGGDRLRQKGIGVPGEQGIQQAPDRKRRSTAGGGRCRGMVNPATIADRLDVLAEHLATYLCLQAGAALSKPVVVKDGAWSTPGYGHLSRSAVRKGFTARLRPELLAARVDELATLGAGDRTAFIAAHARVEDVRLEGDLDGTYVVFDPPYVNATGYAEDCARQEVLATSLDLDSRGAVVCVCEAEPLPLPGWHHVELTGFGSRRWQPGRSKAEWLTLNRPPVRMPYLPKHQLGLFADAGGAA